MKTLLFLCLLTIVNSAKILVVLHVPTPSHYNIGEALVKGLADKGHDVTIASPFKSKIKDINFREIYLDGLIEIADAHRSIFFDVVNNNPLVIISKFSNYTNLLADTTLRCPKMQQLINSGEKFDAVIVEPFGNEALFGLAHIFNSHIMILSTASSSMTNNFAGNVAPYSFVPHSMTPYNDKMTFYQRLSNTIVNLLMEGCSRLLNSPVQKLLYEEIFKNVPPFEETIKNVSLILINSHVVFETPRPFMPNMIPIAGAHIKEPKKLPQDLQTYLDNAKNGVIYFSLGSNLHSRYLSVEKQQIILKTLGKFPQEVIWKFEGENLPNKPANVKIEKWLPQSDILAHPNVKLFITHGGLLSTTETVFRGVPIVGIPVYGDQFSNIANLVKSGYGQSIDLEQLNVEDFTQVIKEVLDNPSYTKNVKKSAALLEDQPDKPLDRAIFWVEHVIRHNGAPHLRSSSIDLPLYQYLLLDVFGAIFAVLVGLNMLLYFLFKKLCCKRRTNEKKNTKKVKPKRE